MHQQLHKIKDHLYIYKYLVKEISEINGFVTTYSVDGGEFKDNLSMTDAVNSSGQHNFVIKNKSESGALKLKKEVTVNNNSTGTKLADGEYEFTITGPDNTKGYTKYPPDPFFTPVLHQISFMRPRMSGASMPGP